MTLKENFPGPPLAGAERGGCMNGLELISEVERIHGDTIKENEGVLILDLSVYYPYDDIDSVSLDFDVYTNMDDGPNENLKQNGSVSNRRHPNKNYVTLSEKAGRKLGRYGYSIVAPIETLNEIKYLTVYFYEASSIPFMFELPLNIRLTKEKPCAGLDFNIGAKDEKNEVTVRLHTPCEDFGLGCWTPTFYTTSKEGVYEIAEKFGENLVSLITTTEGTGRLEQTITLPSCTREQIMV